MLNRYCFTLLICLNAFLASGQENIDWKLLSKVKFRTDYIEDLGAYYMKPKLSREVQAYEGKEVILSGYFIPFNEQKMFFILSRYPLSSCYFCGAAGPESVVELQLRTRSRTAFPNG